MLHVYLTSIVFVLWGAENVFGATRNNATNSTAVTTSNRHGKFFGIGVVRFENGICKAADGYDGTCYTKYQCKSIAGIPSGRCAANIGVCCVSSATCGGTSSNNNTYFFNPDFPSGYTGGKACTLTIQKCNPDICQIRIDFLSFSLSQPNGDSVCVSDSMNVVGGSVVSTICGENSGQHIYVDFNGAADIQIIMSATVNSALYRTWKLKIAQIGCDSSWRAPAGCLQYYNQQSDIVNSFNYGQTISSSLNQLGFPGTRQLANMNYGVCVAMQPGYCSIIWAPVDGDPYAFTLTSSTIILTGNNSVGTPAAYLNGTLCTTDFVVIPNPSVGGVLLPFDRFCGNGLPPVTTSSTPYVLTVVTDGNDADLDMGNRGFSLMFTQNLCPNTNCVFVG